MPYGDPPMRGCWCSLPYEQCCGRHTTAPYRGEIILEPSLRGCVCPPGAEQTCRGDGCPRQPFKTTTSSTTEVRNGP